MNTVLAAAEQVKTASGQRAPLGELGAVDPNLATQVTVGRGLGLPGWAQLAPSDLEHVPALIWPEASRTYRRMVNDPQIAALLQAIWLPAQRYHFALDPNGMDETAAQLLADDLDLPLQGQDRVSPGRRRDAFNFRRHLSRALSALVYGHGVFEIVGRLDDQGRWRLTDLAPRPSWTLDAWLVDKAGRLEAIEQQHVIPPIRMDADRLVVYSWQGEPGDPRGQSLLRPLYGPWVINDRLCRLDVVAHERNSMGIPIGFLPEGATPAERDDLLEILAGMAAGEQSAVVLPYGADARIRGVEGATSGVLESMRYNDERMARALLGMVMQLGQTQTGSRALGGTFMDLLAMFHDNVVTWVCDTLTEQVAEAWVTFNQGTDAPAARVVAEPDTPSAPPAPTAPAVSSVAQPDTMPVQAGAVRDRHRHVSAQADVSTVNLPGRQLRRQPYDHEIAAATDFATLEREFLSIRDQVARHLLDMRAHFTSVAVTHVAGLDSVDPSTLAETLGEALASSRQDVELGGLVALLVAAVRHGEQQIADEAMAQGVTHHPDPVDYEDRALGEAGQLADRVAQQVKDTTVGTARVAAAPGSDGRGVSGRVLDALDKLSTAQVDQAAAGATSRAQLAGRASAIDQAPTRAVYASELLDSNTCGPCTAVDGTEYPSVEEAQRDYPMGGFLGCEGMERCRGTLVAIFDTEQAAVR